MSWFWKDDPSQPRSLILETHDRLPRPSFRLEAARKNHLRFVSGERPFLWARIDGYWSGAEFIRGADSPPNVLAPWLARDMSGVSSTSSSDDWWREWLRRLARVLVDSQESPLYAGRWRLRTIEETELPQSYPTVPDGWAKGHPALPSRVVDTAVYRMAWSEVWDGNPDEQIPRGGVIGLRRGTSADDGRVKAWRKRIRDGTSPPILLWYIPVLRKYLLLDGHDRLLAARLEGLRPPMVALWAEHLLEQSPPNPQALEIAAKWAAGDFAASKVEGVNRYLLKEYAGPKPLIQSRAWPILGGLQAWREEVSARIAAIGDSIPEDVAKLLMA